MDVASSSESKFCLLQKFKIQRSSVKRRDNPSKTGTDQNPTPEDLEIEIIDPMRNPSWWNRRTKLEKRLWLATVIFLFFIFAMAVALAVIGYFYHKNIDISRRNLCLTPGCVQTAAEVISNIDESVNPCDDFYKFACGGWLSRNTIPEDRSSVSVYSSMEDNLNSKLRTLVEKELDGTEAPFFKMVKNMYDSCMDLKSIEATGIEPLKTNLKTLGGWPVVEGSKWDESKFDWMTSVLAFRKLGYNFNTLMSLYVTEDYKNTTVNTITLDQASLGMHRKYLLSGLKDSATEAYFKLMIKTATFLGVDEKVAEKELSKSLQFEMDLANITFDIEEFRNMSELYNKYTIKKLKAEIPQIPWLKYINGLVNDKIYENETLIVYFPEFVKNCVDLLARTEKRVLANYMMWRVVEESISMLPKMWRDASREYGSVLTGESQENPRWEQCIGSLSGTLGMALSNAYVRHFFNEESRDTALELVTYIHKEFMKILENVDWMDESTKREAKAKAKAITSHIGYPKELLNDTAVMEYYKNLTMTNDSFFENIMRLRRWSTNTGFNQLRKPIIKKDWKNYAWAVEVNAFYRSTDNSIEFPAGIWQNPFFKKDRPHYMNFGSIGDVIGHEITHGFDDKGRQYDKDGNNVNWWGKTTDEYFEKKAQCIIDQYSNYTAENGMQLNGVNTQGENIADNGGLKEAYGAYHSWVKDHGPEKLLPGVKYNQNQLFWISAANVWCWKDRPEALKLQIISGVHSPAEFRINGPMSNLPEFSKDFNCPSGSNMNKKHKCLVW